jgi:hypothetical protein
MQAQGLEVQTATTADGKREYYIATQQPYGRYVWEMFKSHRYPKVRAGSGSAIIPPYDVTTWSLPLMMGVDTDRVTLDKAAEQNLKPLTASDWPDGKVEGSGSTYAVLRNSNMSAALLNDLLAKKTNVSVAKDWFEVIDGAGKRESYPAGTLLVESPDMASLAAKYPVNV